MNISGCVVIEVDIVFDIKDQNDNYRHTIFIEYTNDSEKNKYNIEVSGSEYINYDIENIENNKVYFNYLAEYTLSIKIKYISDNKGNLGEVGNFAIYNAYVIGKGSSLAYNRITPSISTSQYSLVRNPVDYSKLTGSSFSETNDNGNISRMFSLASGSTLFNIGLKSILPNNLISTYKNSWEPGTIKTPGKTTDEKDLTHY